MGIVIKNCITYGPSSNNYTKLETDAMIRHIQTAKGSLSLTTNWVESNGIYYQSVNIPGVTEYSKIDLQPNISTINQLISDNISKMVAVNEDGIVKIYTFDDVPSVGLTMQYTKTEVVS